MTKLFLSAVLVATLGGVSFETAVAKESNIGGARDVNDSAAYESFKKRQRAKQAASTNSGKRIKAKKK